MAYIRHFTTLSTQGKNKNGRLGEFIQLFNSSCMCFKCVIMCYLHIMYVPNYVGCTFLFVHFQPDLAYGLVFWIGIFYVNCNEVLYCFTSNKICEFFLFIFSFLTHKLRKMGIGIWPFTPGLSPIYKIWHILSYAYHKSEIHHTP